MRHLAKFGAVILALLFLASCDTVSRTYVMADRAVYAVLAPEYLAYVQADPELDELAKARRIRTIEGWDRQIAAQEPKQ
jgi:hypothetical protein